MTPPTVLADVPESHFQAAWYYSVIVGAMFILVFVGAGWALRGAWIVWRDGDRPAALVVAASTLTAVGIFVGIILTAIVALIRTNGLG
jgi:hypothetical protein